MKARIQNIDWRTLEQQLASDQIITHDAQVLTYERDASLDRGMPDAVVFPQSSHDVVALVKWANENHVPLIARGAGTCLSGGAIAEHGGVMVATSRMKQIIELDEAGRSAVVQPGIVNLVLDQAAKAKGFYYPPDPASGRSATIGGNIAENAGGPHCFKYGVTTNYVMGLQVVLANGQCIRLGGRAFDYPEYDFTGVMTGSEGTLGIITQASVRLIRNVPAVRTLMVAFDVVEDAGNAVSAIIARGLVPATIEFMDQQIMQMIEKYIPTGLPTDAAAALIIEVDGYAASLAPQMTQVVKVLEKFHGRNLRLAETEEERTNIWYARKSVGGALTRIAPAYFPVDCTVPRSKIAQTLAAVTRICNELDLPVAYMLHAGDGNLHPHFFIHNPSDKELYARVMEAGRRTMELCVGLGGSITGEHGVGTEKRAGMLMMFNADEMSAMQDVKLIFDSQHLLNPGKIFPADFPARAPLAQPPSFPAFSGEPTSTQDAAEMLRACAETGRRIYIRNSGTPSAETPGNNVSCSTRALNRISEYAPSDLYVTVGAGMRLDELQTQLRNDHFWVPLESPWQESTVGGIVASNFNAPLRMRYGSIRDLVLSTTVALTDGRIIRTGRPVVKNVAGYDLTKLFVGSYGTLGLMTEITFKITALPRVVSTILVPIDNLEHGLRLSKQVLRQALVASAILLCRGGDAGNIDAPYALVYSVEGLTEDVSAELSQVREWLIAQGIKNIVESNRSGNTLWAEWMRQSSADPLTVRVGVAPKDLSSVIVNNRENIGDASFVADIANGQWYLRGASNVASIRSNVHALGGYAIVLNAPESMRSEFDVWGYVPESIELMRALKSRWDPSGLLNPHTFVV